jgi:hypothetical protein
MTILPLSRQQHSRGESRPGQRLQALGARFQTSARDECPPHCPGPWVATNRRRFRLRLSFLISRFFAKYAEPGAGRGRLPPQRTPLGLILLNRLRFHARRSLMTWEGTLLMTWEGTARLARPGSCPPRPDQSQTARASTTEATGPPAAMRRAGTCQS